MRPASFRLFRTPARMRSHAVRVAGNKKHSAATLVSTEQTALPAMSAQHKPIQRDTTKESL